MRFRLEHFIGVVSITIGWAGCGQQPCDSGEANDEGPQVRLDVSLSTCNHRPEAYIDVPTSTFKRTMVEANGARSFDLESDTLTYQWRMASTPEGSNAVMLPAGRLATFEPDVSGSYGIELIVSDGDLESFPAKAFVRVENRPPVANAGPDFTAPVGSAANLNGADSNDPDGDTLTYQWSFVSVPPGSNNPAFSDPTSPQPSFLVDVAGVYEASLVVSDGEGASEPDIVRIGGGVVGGPPIADAGPDTSGLSGQTIRLDGSGSVDPEGEPLTYRWSLQNAPPGSMASITAASVARPSFVADQVGTYTFQLIVEDGFYESAPDTVTVLVSEGLGEPGDACEAVGCRTGTACFDGTCVGVGLLRFSLSWTVNSDFDLHVLTPNGIEIFFANDEADGGVLDVDDCVGDICRSAVHVENIVFDQMPTRGLYSVWVENYSGTQSGTFSIEVSGAAVGTFSGTLPAQGDASSPRYTVNVP